MEKSKRYAVIIFLLWICTPLLLSSLLFAFNNRVATKIFFIYLIIPAIILSLIAYGISNIKKSALKVALFYGLVGASIWLSPAAYFLKDSELFLSFSLVVRFLIIFIPTLILGILFFLIGKNKENPEEDISDLYLKSYVYSSNSKSKS